MPGETIEDFLKAELSVQRLNVIHNFLWLAGRYGNIRPLHRQKLIQRDIVITENADLHLVWHYSRIFMKPLPLFLLDHAFFNDHLCSESKPADETSTLHASACGLLRSYTYLIVHLSDFRIAINSGLLPPNLEWNTWREFAVEVRKRTSDTTVNQRYQYGELRATRLNLIYYIKFRTLRGFLYMHTRYAALFQENFSWLLMVFVYMTVILSAMQTAMTSHDGVANTVLQEVSYWFCVLSLLSVVGVLGLMFLIFLCNFAGDLFSWWANLGKKRQ